MQYSGTNNKIDLYRHVMKSELYINHYFADRIDLKNLALLSLIFESTNL